MNIIYILLLIVLASIGTGYAYIKSNLNINGTANVTAASWDVHFENLNVTTGSVPATTPASITDDTTVEFSAELAEPNDYYEFTVDVVNDGTMDAMIDSFSISPTLTTAQAKYLEYTITYIDGAPLVNKQELKVNTSETIKVRFKYKENYNKTNYPMEDQSFNIEFSVDYIQDDNTSISIDHPITIYASNLYNVHPEIYLNQTISSSITQYSTATEASAALRTASNDNNIIFYLKHKIQSEIVTESYVEFTITQKIVNASAIPGATAGTYSLRDFSPYENNNCLDEYDNSGVCTSPYYEQNKETLLNAFGSDNCTIKTSRIDCIIDTDTMDYMTAVNINGGANFNDGTWGCSILSDEGASHCGAIIPN